MSRPPQRPNLFEPDQPPRRGELDGDAALVGTGPGGSWSTGARPVDEPDPGPVQRGYAGSSSGGYPGAVRAMAAVQNPGWRQGAEPNAHQSPPHAPEFPPAIGPLGLPAAHPSQDGGTVLPRFGMATPNWPRPPAALPHAMLHIPPEGARLTVCGLVLVRQRPGTANGVIFVTLEDETGISNIIVWRKIYEKYRRAVIAGRMLRVTGRLQRQSGVAHIIAEHVEDLSPMLDDLLAL